MQKDPTNDITSLSNYTSKDYKRNQIQIERDNCQEKILQTTKVRYHYCSVSMYKHTWFDSFSRLQTFVRRSSHGMYHFHANINIYWKFMVFAQLQSQFQCMVMKRKNRHEKHVRVLRRAQRNRLHLPRTKLSSVRHDSLSISFHWLLF